MIRIATFNVHYLKNTTNVGNLLRDNKIDVCGMQEVAGQQSLNKLTNEFTNFTGVFDGCYKSYGNGLVYNHTKFEFVSKKCIILREEGSKKTAFNVVLYHIESNRSYNFFVTHLDHVSEKQRLKEWNTFLQKASTHFALGVTFLLGDFNALKRTDYSDQEWRAITDVRINNRWEKPETDLIDQIERDGFIDLWGKFGTPKPTSRFNTRIDYIFSYESKDLDNNRNTTVNAIDRILTNTSDHMLVLCDLFV